MRKTAIFTIVAFAMSAFAQEGHPLTGTWVGDWTANPSQRNHITLVLSWEGNDKIGGVINPGPDSVQIQAFVVDYAKWSFRFEAEAKDAGGKPVRIEADGVFENLGSPNRKLCARQFGVWRRR